MKVKVARKIDVGMILLGVSDDELTKLNPIMEKGHFQAPNLKISVYKNRRGSYKGVYLYCKADLGTCRVQPLFCTTYNHTLVPIEDAKIIVSDESVF